MNLLLKISAIVLILIATVAMSSEAGTTHSVYEKLAWDSSIKSVIARYPRGQIGKLAEEVVYRQYKPSPQIARRNFAFSKDKLHTVTVVYEKHYIEKYGIEKLLRDYSKRYGDGVMNTSQAPHMISCSWQSGDTRVQLAYAPKRPDMTVIIYEKAKSEKLPPAIMP